MPGPINNTALLLALQQLMNQSLPGDEGHLIHDGSFGQPVSDREMDFLEPQVPQVTETVEGVPIDTASQLAQARGDTDLASLLELQSRLSGEATEKQTDAMLARVGLIRTPTGIKPVADFEGEPKGFTTGKGKLAGVLAMLGGGLLAGPGRRDPSIAVQAVDDIKQKRWDFMKKRLDAKERAELLKAQRGLGLNDKQLQTIMEEFQSNKGFSRKVVEEMIKAGIEIPEDSPLRDYLPEGAADLAGGVNSWHDEPRVSTV
jgi:hypothetical protein